MHFTYFPYIIQIRPGIAWFKHTVVILIALFPFNYRNNFASVYIFFEHLSVTNIIQQEFYGLPSLLCEYTICNWNKGKNSWHTESRQRIYASMNWVMVAAGNEFVCLAVTMLTYCRLDPYPEERTSLYEAFFSILPLHASSPLPLQRLYGRLTRCVKLRVAYAPGIPETFTPPPTSKEIAE